MVVLGITLVGVAGPSTAWAIVGRHDREDARFVELGDRFPAVGRVLPEGGCTLIAPQWALTAAHVAAPLAKNSGKVRFADKEYAVIRVVIHPEADVAPGRPPESDLALLELAEPVKGITPLDLYEGREELGKTATLVGFGDVGDGRRAPRRGDGLRRAATNVVTDAGPRRIFFKFDAPPEGTDLEGIGGPGDSGGPALLEQNGKVRVVGVRSASRDGEPGRYGVTDVYMRVGSYVEWIRNTTRPAAPATQEP